MGRHAPEPATNAPDARQIHRLITMQLSCYPVVIGLHLTVTDLTMTEFTVIDSLLYVASKHMRQIEIVAA